MQISLRFGRASPLDSIGSKGAIVVNARFISHLDIPNVIMVPISDEEATWDVFVIWQRGKTAGALRALLDELTRGHGY